MTSKFNMLDHLDQLNRAEGRDKKGCEHCPVCADDQFHGLRIQAQIRVGGSSV